MSEKLAFQACAKLANEVLESQGISKRYTGQELVSEFVGQNFRGMMERIQERHNFNLPDAKLDSYVNREVAEVIKKLKADAEECPGATEVLAQLAAEGKYNMAVVSSSAGPRVEASIIKVGHDQFFLDERGQYKVYSAATSLREPTSKPNPAIYLHALRDLDGRPECTVAVEDSRSGAMAAKNAGLWVIAYVGAYDDDEKEEAARMLMEEVECHELMWEWEDFQSCLDKICRVCSFSPERSPWDRVSFVLTVPYRVILALQAICALAGSKLCKSCFHDRSSNDGHFHAFSRLVTRIVFSQTSRCLWPQIRGQS